MKKLFCLVLFFPICLLALPQELTIQSGTATSKMQSNHLHIENSPNAVLHWKNFSIEKGEKVHFKQPNAHSAVLNRVTSKEHSHLLGHLSSNGQVFLINPNGILIGNDAQVKTGGFLASTAEISNESFLKGSELIFHSPGPGEINNQGRISCPQGDIFLISKTIRNEGKLSGKHVHLVSAQEVLIRPQQEKRILIRAALEEGHIENTGVIEALAVDLQTTSPYEKAIRQEGYIEATSTRRENGHIYLVAENGGTEVNGSMMAQDIQVLGQEVLLEEQSYIDASGPEGGTVLIGGDYQGENPDILNAKRVTVKEGAVIHVDGTSGDAGKVILWGDEGMLYKGFVSAQALGETGDGGFVEVSSHGYYGYDGSVNALSKNGKKGTLLLDPFNVTIGVAGVNLPLVCPTNYVPPASVTLTNTSIQDILNTNNCDLTIDTTGTGGFGNGDITFNASVTWNGNSSFICNADRDVIFNANVTNNGEGSFTVNANRAVVLSPGGVTISSTSANPNEGNITLRGLGNPASLNFKGIYVRGSNIIQTDAGTITLEGTGGTGFQPDGIDIEGIVRTTSGNIYMTGVGTSDTGDGLQINTGQISSSSGSIFLNGAAASSLNQGVQILQPSAFVRTGGNGNIEIRGSSPSLAILIQSSALVETSQGDILIEGNGGVGVNLVLPGAIQSSSGNISISGIGSDAFGIRIASLFSVSTSGNVTLDGQSTNLDRGIELFDGTISTTGTGMITLNGRGGPNGTDNEGVLITNGGSSISSVDGAINITGNSNGDGSNSHGISVISNGSIASTGIGSITLNGTGSPNATSGDTYGVYVSGTTSNVTSNSGSINITALGGGAAGNNNTGLLIDGSGEIVTTSGIITANATGGTAGITNSGISIENSGSQVRASSGAINLRGTAGANTQEGISISSFGTVVSTTSAPITLQTFSDILVQTSGSIDSQGTGDALLIATDNIHIAPTGQVMTNMGSLTLVVDNRFPAFPDVGTGAFILDAGGVLTSGGELRIYTARQSQNMINELINGLAYAAGSFDVDTPTETWRTYYPNGTYGGLAFNLYYKEPIIPIILPTPSPALVRMFFTDVAANLVQLPSLLPILIPMRLPFTFPSYHFQVCGEKDVPELCSPNFSPYGSFIFEDDLWWIGEEF